jgi:hypothetical protein
LLHRIGAAPPKPAEGDNLGLHTVHLLVQMLAALRNLAALEEHRTAFVATGLIPDLCILLDVYSSEVDFMLNISRVFSKLTLHSDCRLALARVVDIMPLLMKSVIKHQHNLPLTHRLLFTLGNMTATDPESRTDLFLASSRGEDLLVLLASYTAAATDNVAAAAERDDVLTKLVRVIANLCINPEIGAEIACSEGLRALIDLLRRQQDNSSEDLILHVVGAINNLSFYRKVRPPVLYVGGGGGGPGPPET